MIEIFFGPPGVGKTSCMVACGNSYAFNKNRNRAMQFEVMRKNTNGFNLTIPRHCVSANFDVIFKKFRYSPRLVRRINPYRLGFKNPFVETHFNLPFEVIMITEAQKYFNSRMSMYYPDWQSRWFEMHRHNDLVIMLDTQRPMLIDVNIRELATFTEVINMDIKYDKHGKFEKIIWKVRRIENSSLFDKYMSSGKTDTTCYVEDEIVSYVNVFTLYDSQSCKPRFYDGHFNEDFDLKYTEPTEESLEGYIKFLKENDDEMPDGFYQKRKVV